MKHNSDTIDEGLSRDNIDSRLWALPDAHADREVLCVFNLSE